jgi:peptidoglycan L-alanyl-D-glutamate endopeptidase CwlK
MPEFSERSRKNLETCHPDLQKLFKEIIKEYDCTILCGHRNEYDQNECFRSGKSKLKWPNGKHNSKPSEAVDAVPFPISWSDLKRMIDFSKLVKAKALELNIKIRWGGDFKGFPDMPHYELTKEN